MYGFKAAQTEIPRRKLPTRSVYQYAAKWVIRLPGIKCLNEKSGQWFRNSGGDKRVVGIHRHGDHVVPGKFPREKLRTLSVISSNVQKTIYTRTIIYTETRDAGLLTLLTCQKFTKCVVHRVKTRMVFQFKLGISKPKVGANWR